MKHEAWLFLWFFVGMATYMVKRGYYLITGPNPVANTVTQFLRRCWAPLLVRAALESVVFWACFTPELLTAGLNALGWSSASGVVAMITQFAPMAFMFGHTIDSIADIAVNKIPGIKDILPQMPGPLPPASPQEAAPKP